MEKINSERWKEEIYDYFENTFEGFSGDIYSTDAERYAKSLINMLEDYVDISYKINSSEVYYYCQTCEKFVTSLKYEESELEDYNRLICGECEQIPIHLVEQEITRLTFDEERQRVAELSLRVKELEKKSLKRQEDFQKYKEQSKKDDEEIEEIFKYLKESREDLDKMRKNK